MAVKGSEGALHLAHGANAITRARNHSLKKQKTSDQESEQEETYLYTSVTWSSDKLLLPQLIKNVETQVPPQTY